MSKSKIVSIRIDEDIADAFAAICNKLKIKKSVVSQELFKDFIVRNIRKESHDNVEILSPKLKELDEES